MDERNQLYPGQIWNPDNPVGTDQVRPQYLTNPDPGVVQPVQWGPFMLSPATNALLQGAVANAMNWVNMGPVARNRLLSTDAALYNVPSRTPRPFEADYPHGAPSDAAGRLTHDIEGRPLGARFIAGRSVVGGGDQAVAPTQYDALAEAAIGSRPAPATARSLGRGIAGEFGRTASPTGDAQYNIYFLRSLTPASAQRVVAHELGHMVDTLSGRIQPTDISQELNAVYNELAGGNIGFGRQTLPKDRGYKGEKVNRELIAESVRAYLTDPNYLKTQAPEVAKAIRAAVNAHPRLKDIIQFNSVAGGLALGAGAVSE